MKTTLKIVTALFLASCLHVIAADEATTKKTKRAPASLAERSLKRYEAAGLTDEQTAKIKELASAAEGKLAELKKAAALNDDQKTAQKAAIKTAKDAGKDKKQMREEVQAAVKLTDAQTAAQVELKKVQGEYGKATQALLTDDQKTKLRAAAEAKKKKPAAE